MKVGQIRQGDILLVPVEATPPDWAETASEVILAEGEVTGHAHRLRGAVILDWSIDGLRYVRVMDDAPGTLSHEDHDPAPAAVVAPAVTYRVVPQKQWNLTDQWERVED